MVLQWYSDFRGSAYHGNTLDWELGGLGSGPHYRCDLEEVTFWCRVSLLICKWSYCTKQGFQDNAGLGCIMRWLVKGHLNPPPKLTGHHTHQPPLVTTLLSVGHWDIPVSFKNANTSVKTKAISGKGWSYLRLTKDLNIKYLIKARQVT